MELNHSLLTQLQTATNKVYINEYMNTIIFINFYNPLQTCESEIKLSFNILICNTHKNKVLLYTVKPT